MRNSARILFLCILVLFSTPLLLFAADPIMDLRNKIKEREDEIARLEKEISAYQGSLEQQSTHSQTLGGEIKKLETQIKKLTADIRWTEAQIQKTGFRIEELNGEIDGKKNDIEEGKAVLAELIKSLNESDDSSLIEILFARGTLSDFLGDRENTFRVNRDLEREIRNQQVRKKNLEEERNKKEQQELEYTSFKRDLSGRKSIQESVNTEKNELLKESQNKESQFQKLLREREEKRKLIQDELIAIEEELRARIDPSLLPQKRKGILGWPVAGPFITQGFGFTQFAQTYGSDIYKGKGHNGVDFRASVGARVLAVEDGKVKDFGNTDTICKGGSYGKWVIVEHPNNLSSLYAHLSSVAVTRGQNVRRGDLVAYSGATGYVTGPHLHLTIYASDTYELRKTNHCGVVPAGGFIDPMDYLPDMI
ncbi:MAG: hypothetical protein A3F26_02405 [Candidatus Ryanbacteria bacterium RIFCSPHIGHO2_12_FULL_47_12b]|uniref:M23ase beta-sheet core domain-containing protein n=1 Tax=Candidatus Ryanbacteria bacterium RIFCSPLOWO2_02_FULL_47_14 TaxID=1802129 RepID=A0A1G2H1U6_9BACT|nr:MAG: hypothetical protein A2844_00400 [Candidatus Ryanbacteria bacterium RIFCSPHIGHO2_01_FULL_48_80]OGZ47946.1 MAG: hypothetical protein A3C83_03040 [Candidatus Ryanbacteria bacterium RIFCSPHIGHO2_02_FULL_47_25]OGZ51600.1 MAG: hypothetical protein A3F26_02405 [Candidatus Ryanbacteria bacterium RIFCSPHIGHO2_12_FULL_47_12b]OGZ52504.1 MAG: hypothetical protein A3A29_00480 [Candidatus Ryanbacteria bacterium RIFCSPLOWO2_01_FULL_47_79]OGZ56456.1 MAG: hypothetical protein A3J04_00475 [Candidatus Ry